MAMNESCALNQIRWRKLGHVWAARGDSEMMHSHGKSRAVLDLGDRLRAYTMCYGRPTPAGDITCRTFYVDLDRSDPTKVIYVSSHPVLSLGQKGEFDEHGVMAEMVLDRGSEIWMYYDGWSRRSSVPYDWAIGLAISQDGGLSFERNGRGPILGPSAHEPFLQASPFVLVSDSGVWHMWYLSGDSWKTDEQDQLYATYRIRHASSEDGITWLRNEVPCLDTILEDECQAGPTVFRHNGSFHMIFSYRSGQRKNQNSVGYALGHAISEDLQKWTRCGDVVFNDPGDEVWDLKMKCYPQVLTIENRVLLFYSGNEYGRTGFGVAELIH